jgi:hypothetical protein
MRSRCCGCVTAPEWLTARALPNVGAGYPELGSLSAWSTAPESLVSAPERPGAGATVALQPKTAFLRFAPCAGLILKGGNGRFDPFGCPPAMAAICAHRTNGADLSGGAQRSSKAGQYGSFRMASSDGDLYPLMVRSRFSRSKSRRQPPSRNVPAYFTAPIVRPRTRCR